MRAVISGRAGVDESDGLVPHVEASAGRPVGFQFPGEGSDPAEEATGEGGPPSAGQQLGSVPTLEDCGQADLGGVGPR
jgi:hypothetical protein